MRFKKFLIVLSLIIYLITNQVLATKFSFDHLTVKDGLSQSWVRAIHQDMYGFIWIGTNDGLNLYDGYKFTVFKNNPRDPFTISGNIINDITETPDSTLWIATSEGVCTFNRPYNRFSHRFFSHIDVYSLALEHDHTIWMGTDSGLFKLDLKTKQLNTCAKNSFNKMNPEDRAVSKVYLSKDNNIWFISPSGLHVYLEESDRIKSYSHNDRNPQSLSSNRVLDIFQDHAGRFWVGTQSGLDIFMNAFEKPDTGIFKHYRNKTHNPNHLNNDVVSFLFEDAKHRLWIGTEHNGLYMQNLEEFDEEKLHLKHITYNPNNPDSLNNNTINYIYEDDQHNLWFGTFGNGINIFSSFRNKFQHLFKIPNNKNALIHNYVNVFLEDEKYLWIGTEGGLSRYNKKNKDFKHFIHDPNDSGSISSNAVWALCKDRFGDLWVGTWAGGLNRFNSETGTFEHFYHHPEDPKSIGSNNVFSIYEDTGGILWVGTMGGGLSRYNRQNKSFTNYNTNNSNIHENFVESIIEIDNGKLLLANVSSTEVFDTKTNKFIRRYINIPGDTSSLNGKKIYTNYQDSQGNLWIGTDAGINLLDTATGTFICYRTQDGLPDNSIKSIVEDDLGNLWLGTNKGLSKFINGVRTPYEPKFRNFTIEDGLQSYEFNRRASLKGKDGLLYFGGTNGYNIFMPGSIKYNPYVPRVIISDFHLFNKPVEIGKKDSPLKKHISLTDQITLDHDQDVFTFHYVGINYICPANNQYAYKMENFEKKWNYVGNKKEATYTNLDPGEYMFRVKASNNDGLWNEKGTSLKIKILPAWYETILFRILLIIFLAGIGFLIYIYRIKSLQKQKEKLEMTVEKRTQELNEKNRALIRQTTLLNEANSQLKDRQDRIEEQSEELRSQTDELRYKNEQLEYLNATKDKFFSIIAHDLKNPFNNILGFMDLLRKEVFNWPIEKTERIINVVYNSTKSAYELLENLLTWSRTQRDSIQFKPIDIEAKLIVDKALQIVKENAENKNIRLNYKIDPPGLHFTADYNMVFTILRNLLNNAIKYTPREGHVELTIQKNKDHFEIRVQDSGIGMDEETRKHLFDIHNKESQPGTENEKGTGLGLILCKEFIDKHKGSIEIGSKKDKGSAFIIKIPFINYSSI